MMKALMLAVVSLALASPAAAAFAARCEHVFTGLSEPEVLRQLKSRSYAKSAPAFTGLVQAVLADGGSFSLAMRDPAFLRFVGSVATKMETRSVDFGIRIAVYNLLGRIDTAYVEGKTPGLKTMAEMIDVTAAVHQLDRKSGNFVDDVTNWLVNGLDAVPGLPQLPPYNRFKIVKENVRRATGRPYVDLQDVAVSRDFTLFDDPANPNAERKVRAVAISSTPFEGEKPAPYGFHFKELASAPLTSAHLDLDFAWKAQGQRPARGHVRYEVLPARGIVPPAEASPRYAEMLADGKLSGAVVIAANLADFAPELSLTYAEYFRKRGFVLSKPRELTTAEASEWILSRLRNGELDYLVREGHAEFGGDVAFTWGDGLRVIEARREGAPAEAMTLIFPTSPRPTAIEGPDRAGAVSRMQIGEALRGRAQASRPFVFFDTACSAVTGIKGSIEAVAAPGFTPVAAAHLMDTFTPTRGDPIFEFMNGFRAGLSWDAINRRIKKSGRLAFPDTADYLSAADRANLHPFRVDVRRDF